MGYRGKLREQEAARALRAEGKTLQQIADELGVSKSSASIWVRDVPFTPSKRRWGPQRRPNPASVRKQRQIAECDEGGRRLVGVLEERAFFVAGIALYAGEGSKTDGSIKFANSNASMMRLFAAWLRHFFDIDESRLRMRVYLHEGLDLERAEEHWSRVVDVPRNQFGKAYRPPADPSIRTSKHEFGCAYLDYGCSLTHRRVMGLVRALLSAEAIPG